MPHDVRNRMPHRYLIAAIAAALVAVFATSGFGEARRTRVRAPQSTIASLSPLPPLPAGWPATLQLGMSDGPGGAAAMKATAAFDFRYQYLAGGVNTGNGWATWNANGAFVTYYIQESIANNITPVFTYYQMRQSSPGDAEAEATGVYDNTQNTATMTSYWNDLKLFFQRAGAFPNAKTVLHMEPDFWGYMQQRSTNDDAATVPAKVAATGMPELAGLPDNVSGFARAVVKLRDLYASNVIVAYHMSGWGTNHDITYENPSDTNVDAYAVRSGNFYNSLHANFDIAFTDQADRDAAFKQYIYGDGGASWWDSEDYRRSVLYLARFVAVAQKRVVIWQIPYGNTKMRAVNNTWGHYQDNHVEWLLDDPPRTHLTDYANAGVVAFMFGGGAGGTTCACDAQGDGVTNPAPINGNVAISLNADDDGGYFRSKASAYYTAGAIVLPSGSVPTPTSTTTATRTPTPTSTQTPTATATRTPDIAVPRNETIVALP